MDGGNKPMKERLNYIVTQNFFVGATVNMPLCVQGESLEEMVANMKRMAKVYVEHLQEWINSDEPFELKELNQEEWRAQK